MISVNVAAAADSSKLSALTPSAKPTAPAPSASAAAGNAGGASTVVELSGTLTDNVSTERKQVSRTDAERLSFDIAGMLAGSFGVQSNINSFDAARLLAD